MTLCYECQEQFYGRECPACGWVARYKCWNCGAGVIPEECEHCKACGWYDCPECGQCGCDEFRPLSKEERGEVLDGTVG